MSTSLIGKKIGNYNITALLGEGGMGSVYLGEHPLIGKKVAVKVLHEELAVKQDIVGRFFTEAKAVNDIHHENIVDIVDFGQMKDETGKELVYFLMEYLEGDALSARLKAGPMAPEEAVHIIEQCASALAASHAKKIVHRDIKPDNIFLVHRGHDSCFAKLLDFGIAKLTGGVSSQTRTGTVLGTPAYMSPEQCDGRGNIDYRSDIYSLGIVLYELLCGRVPFLGEGFGEILVAQLAAPVPAPSTFNPNVPPALEQITLRCLEKNRDARFQSMDELRAALLDSGSYVAPRPLTGRVPLADPSAIAPTLAGPAPTGRTGSGTAQRPTTLSGSAAEVGAAPPVPARSKVPIIAAFGALAVAAGVAAFVLAKRPEPKQVGQPVLLPDVVKAPPPVDDTVRVLIDSTPQGAVITRAGKSGPVGTTPSELKLKRGEASFDVLLSLNGYQAQSRTVTTDRDHDFLISLPKVEAPPPPQTDLDHAKPVRAADSHHSGSRHGHDAKPPSSRPNSADPDGVLAPKL